MPSTDIMAHLGFIVSTAVKVYPTCLGKSIHVNWVPACARLAGGLLERP